MKAISCASNSRRKCSGWRKQRSVCRYVDLPDQCRDFATSPSIAAPKPNSAISVTVSISGDLTGGVLHNRQTAPYALWFLRLTLAIALMVHVQFNLGAFDSAAAMHWLGLPTGVSLFAITLEILVAFALIFGIWPRVAALTGAGVLLHAVAVTRGVAALTGAHLHSTAPAAWIGALLLLSLAGDGAFTLVPTASRSRKTDSY
jgi:putative oxidoreductase